MDRSGSISGSSLTTGPVIDELVGLAHALTIRLRSQSAVKDAIGFRFNPERAYIGASGRLVYIGSRWNLITARFTCSSKKYFAVAINARAASSGALPLRRCVYCVL
jgi:hypothetical protein